MSLFLTSLSLSSPSHQPPSPPSPFLSPKKDVTAKDEDGDTPLDNAENSAREAMRERARQDRPWMRARAHTHTHMDGCTHTHTRMHTNIHVEGIRREGKTKGHKGGMRELEGVNGEWREEERWQVVWALREAMQRSVTDSAVEF